MDQQNFLQEIARRRTFAIISHPDAGKTTLTEKLLLFGGAIQEAGAVKSNKIKRHVTSDFMEIERQRGISVATSVMGFEYNGAKVNILDTPGHQDFAEDTYRTLTAVDSVIVVVDVAKGVEPQTERLVEVSRMRATPMMIFINKLDREGLDAFSLMDEIEQKLNLRLCPMTWPIGMGKSFKGVYSMYHKRLILFDAHTKQEGEGILKITDLDSSTLDDAVGERPANTLREELELVSGVYPAFDREDYLAGKICPLFFGSAINNFGVKELLEAFIGEAPAPLPTATDERVIRPEEDRFAGFVFKIHANIDPNHRNRIAFVRVCSGIFERNKPYHHVRLNKKLRFPAPTSFMAAKKSVVDEAFPGDIVGLYDAGNFVIGDTLTEGEIMHFKGIPSFSPEIFRYVENAEPMKSKQFAKGLEQLTDEGVAQLFYMTLSNRRVVGTVGALQLDVIQFRLEHEYSAACRFEMAGFFKACWVTSDSNTELKSFVERKSRSMAKDKRGRDVFMAASAWDLNSTQELFPGIKFHFTSEH